MRRWVCVDAGLHISLLMSGPSELRQQSCLRKAMAAFMMFMLNRFTEVLDSFESRLVTVSMRRVSGGH